MKKKLFLCDLVIGEHICNQSCEYCLTKYDNFTENEKEKSVLLQEYNYMEGGDLHRRLNKILDNLLDEFEVATLKIIGGEILMIPNIILLLEERSEQFINVQLMTNGILLDENKIERLSKIKNMHLQISVDSSNYEGNYYRNKNQLIHERLLKNIDLAVKAGISLEINCVLNDRSIEYLEEYLIYLKQYDSCAFKIFPFPVRGDEKDLFIPRKEQFAVIQNIIEHYDSYGTILPPIQYFDNLLTFLGEAKRQRMCAIPFHSFQTFDNGEVTPCPYWWTTSIGNIMEDKSEVANAIANKPVYRMILGKKPKLKSCDKCYIRAEVLNLYFEDILTIDELAEVPFYADQRIKKFLIEMKHDYKERYQIYENL